MNARIHPLSGKPINGKPANGKPRAELSAAMNGRKASLSFDAARAGTDLDAHFAFADTLDADSSYSQGVRHTLIKRSRYEQGSNGIYDGIINTHCNMLVGVGPTLRMLTKNRSFNQLVEREFFAWSERVQLRRKLWAMAHSRTGDGESFAVLQSNPAFPGVQLDFQPIEPEQCQTPYGSYEKNGIVDGIRYDQFNNVIAYDILPYHPGASFQVQSMDAETVPASTVLHWFKLKRPGAHRGIPDCTSSLGVGAKSRRHREATVAAAETAANLSAISTTNHSPDSDGADPVAPFTGVPLTKNTWLFNPMGWDIHQMKAEHPNATYADFHRLQTSETARPLSMPYNAAACDSSTYSFASGKLDTLCYRAALDVERKDCDDLVLNRIFAAWFREWRLLYDGTLDEAAISTPLHQWDWPAHPVIDEVSSANATKTKLETGTTTIRQVYSDQGQDYEDALLVMAEDWLGEATDENVLKARQINMLRMVSQHAMPYVAQLIGLQPVAPGQQQPSTAPDSGEAASQMRAMADRIELLESRRR